MNRTKESDVYRQLAAEAPVDADARSALHRIARILDSDASLNTMAFAHHAYFFLTHTLSAPQSIFLRHLKDFRGDALREAYLHASGSKWKFDYDPVTYRYYREMIGRLAYTTTTGTLNSAQLACALTLFNLTPLRSAYRGKTLLHLERGVRYEYQQGNHFWKEHGLSENQLVELALDLARYNGSDLLEPSEIASRFRLCISVGPEGLAVFPTERWGLQPVASSHGETIVRELILPENALVSSDQLEGFADLLAGSSVAESDWQRFFDQCPVFLYLLGDYDNHRREVALIPQMTFDETPELGLRPDFILKRMGLNLWDLLEIKLPSAGIVSGSTSRRHLSGPVVSALAQIRAYSNFFRDSSNFQWFRRTHGAEIVTPRLHLLIGRDSSFRDEREKGVFTEAEGVRVITYDDLFRIAKHRSLRVDKT